MDMSKGMLRQLQAYPLTQGLEIYVCSQQRIYFNQAGPAAVMSEPFQQTFRLLLPVLAGFGGGFTLSNGGCHEVFRASVQHHDMLHAIIKVQPVFNVA
jgi:hypothetical protein